jgi:hypothetical protein
MTSNEPPDAFVYAMHSLLQRAEEEGQRGAVPNVARIAEALRKHAEDLADAGDHARAIYYHSAADALDAWVKQTLSEGPLFGSERPNG